MSDVKKELGIVVAALKADAGYYETWKANIAMAFKDEWQREVNAGGLPSTPEQIHVIANRAADYFLGNLLR